MVLITTNTASKVWKINLNLKNIYFIHRLIALGVTASVIPSLDTTDICQSEYSSQIISFCVLWSLALVVEVLIVLVSLRGTILEDELRWGAEYLLYLKLGKNIFLQVASQEVPDIEWPINPPTNPPLTKSQRVEVCCCSIFGTYFLPVSFFIVFIFPFLPVSLTFDNLDWYLKMPITIEPFFSLCNYYYI